MTQPKIDYSYISEKLTEAVKSFSVSCSEASKALYKLQSNPQFQELIAVKKKEEEINNHFSQQLYED